MSNSTVKEEARRLVEGLPEDATWEDLQYAIYVRQAIEAGLKDSREGRTVPWRRPAGASGWASHERELDRGGFVRPARRGNLRLLPSLRGSRD